MTHIKEVLALNFQLAESVGNFVKVPTKANKISYADLKSCPGRVTCLARAAIYFVAFLFGPVVGPCFALYTYSDEPYLWDDHFGYCLLDSALLVFTSPFLFLALSIKNLAGAIINPKICLKEQSVT